MEKYGVDDSNTIFGPLLFLLRPDQKIYYLYLLSSILVALLFTVYDRVWNHNPTAVGDLEASVVSKRIWFGRSALNDYLFFYLNTLLYTIIMAPFFFVYTMVSSRLQLWLVQGFGAPVESSSYSLWMSLLYSFGSIAMYDFGMYISHYVQHLNPVLWQFHKVHHSAEVMNPITVYRMHPIDDVLSVVMAGFFSGIVDALFRYFATPDIQFITVFDINMFLFIFYVAAYNLRHSHVWVSWGVILSRLLISPAQHQIHHSKAVKHYDKNFGLIFAWWDWMFGTLYVPKTREKLEFGLSKDEEREFSSVAKLYLLPFSKAWEVLTGKRRH